MAKTITKHLAVIMWIRQIQDQLGGVGLGGIEKWVLKMIGKYKEDFWQSYTKRFYQYIKGNRLPSNHYRQLIGKLLPGSLSILYHPLWWIIDHPLATQAKIDKQMPKLEPNVYRRLFRHSKRSLIVKRRKIRGVQYVSNLARENNLDALAALLMLIREAELNKDFITYVDAKWETQDLISRLSTFNPFKEIAVPINDLIDKRFIHRSSPYPEMPTTKGTFEESDYGPNEKPEIISESQNNGQTILEGIVLGVLLFDEKKQLDYLFLANKLATLNEIQQANHPQLELFPKELSKKCRILRKRKWNLCSIKNKIADQFNWNMQLHALVCFAHRSGFT